MEASLHAAFVTARYDWTFMTARRVLVVGSYPPVPGAPAAATVAAVRRAWDGGAEVVVVSPRPSAAPFVVPLAGPALGRELAKLRLAHACNEVVLCLEPGWPFAGVEQGRMPPTPRERSPRLLAASSRAEIVVTGELDVAPRSISAAVAISGDRHREL